NRAISISIMLSLTRSVDECHIKKDFLYFLNYLWKCSVNAKCRRRIAIGNSALTNCLSPPRPLCADDAGFR
ncbi:MAG: hypothetical protein ACOX84_04670, partial [Methanothrix sp.]|uniref:hypothetical protein n=1 Tax=Methanothrix sp. TaxID=90426 RepID=UPI003D8E3B00